MSSFAHEMLREIYEQPDALRRTWALYLAGNELRPEVAGLLADWTNPEGEILIAASGSSRHSGLAAEILLERKSRKTSPDTTSTIGDFVDDYYIPCVERDRKASTSNGYKGIWERYLRSRCAAVWLKDVQTFHVQRWLDDIAREHGWRGGGIRSKHFGFP